MEIHFADIAVFLLFLVAVVAVGLIKSRNENDSESYFLAGRGLSWWLIGFSLIAANISTEQFVGMSGQAADYIGLAVATWEWLAGITLVVTAFFVLPKFLRAGIYTVPQFLEQRFDKSARSLMAVLSMATFVLVSFTAVVYSGALMATTLFPESISIAGASWAIGVLAAVYVAAGGLKACAWADLLQGSALIVGGAIMLWLAIDALAGSPVASLSTTADVQGLADSAGGWEKFFALNEHKLHMALPADDTNLPWTVLLIGAWIPNFYYWGLNQYITQRTLGSHSLAHGQRGVVFAAALKLVIPFVIVFPGIIAFNLYSGDMEAAATDGNAAVLASYEQAKAAPDKAESLLVVEFEPAWASAHPEQAVELAAWNDAVAQRVAASGAAVTSEKLIRYKFDTAFGLLVKKLVPGGHGLRGFILAAILGAVISSLASMLNAASTIFTMDLFREYVRRDASQQALVRTGRVAVAVFTVIGCLIAPLLDSPVFKGIFNYIQEFQGFISPGILCVCAFGLFVPRSPAKSGLVGLLTSPLVYGVLKLLAPDMAFLNRMAVTSGVVVVVMTAMTVLMPRTTPHVVPPPPPIDLRSCPIARAIGIAVGIATVTLYVIFW
ncbi:MAG: sodium/solute symporter [Planctomycetes bacterium]|nr:sodium/solute symporter [Planctomycetota bacterium]